MCFTLDPFEKSFLSICPQISVSRKITLFEITLKSREKGRLFGSLLKFLFAHISENINIRSIRSFFEITLVKSRFVHIPENIKIQEKFTFLKISFKKTVFWTYVQNLNISRKITLFEDYLKIVVFCPYLRKYQRCEEKHSSLSLF